MNGDHKPGTKAARARACPMCGKPAAAAAHLPFCSRRCADLDLGLWFKGTYRIPAVEPPDSLDDESARGAGSADEDDRE